MKRRIILEQMSFFANHGCFEAERITGNTFTVDLAVDFDFSRAESTDNLADTLDYSRLYALVKEEMQRPANLLESVAGRIVARIDREFPEIKGGMLRLKKSAPAMGGQLGASGVEIEW